MAIAVDNLANAQELTAAEEADEKANEISDDTDSLDEYNDGDQCAIDIEGRMIGEELGRDPDGIHFDGSLSELKMSFRRRM